jgi:hypothetical protein
LRRRCVNSLALKQFPFRFDSDFGWLKVRAYAGATDKGQYTYI